MQFHKYQALGNDYVVVEPEPLDPKLTPELIRRICDRHFGLGSDGILLRDATSTDRFALTILNPDGSAAEKSGNGLRIFARYLWDRGWVNEQRFEIVTKGGSVQCEVRELGRSVYIEMGRATFDSTQIPVVGNAREVIDEPLLIGGESLRMTAVSVGNPHCVLPVPHPTPELAKRLGPLIEREPRFPNRTNVQFVEVLDRHTIRIEIWERGAGYTLASGTSSCAAAAAAVKLGLCDRTVTVRMPGGELAIGVGPDYAITMLGAVGKVAEGSIARELLISD